VIVVPTVALALDLADRLEARIGHRVAYRPDEPHEAEAIRQRCAAGVQGPVILSPEALVGHLLASLHAAARQGWLRYFAIDEAHMVLSWGDEFRPAFLRLQAVRRDLLRDSPAPQFVTVLLSGTLTDYHLRWLREMFSDGSGFVLVHAARLRPEPILWSARAADEMQRAKWIEDAVFNLPRPTIVYTTRATTCIRWYQRLFNLGFKRMDTMTGKTPGQARRRLLNDWKGDRIDLVVATSAFGLGVDKPDVRTVIHAELPESVDRFYQDVGRAGRDGRASVSLMVTIPADLRAAARLSPKFITGHVGRQRWRRMYEQRENLSADGDIVAIRLHVGRMLDMSGDYNRAWNLRTLQLLQRVAALEFVSDTDDSFDRVAVRVRPVRHLDEEFWRTTVDALRQELAADYMRAKSLLRRLFVGERNCIAHLFADCYSSDAFSLGVVRACGGCAGCQAIKRAPYCGPLLARRVPPRPMPGKAPGAELSRMLAGSRMAVILYPEHSTPEDLRGQCADLLWWLASQGTRNFVVPEGFGSALLDLARQTPHCVTFRHERPPREFDVTALQPAATLLTRVEPAWWPELWRTIGSRVAPMVLIAPIDLPSPDGGGRLLRDVMACPVFDLRDWANTFVA
jgi:hypothetical protein